jgi:cytochrome c oxidase subunit IV
VDTEIPEPSPASAREASSCWFRGCMVLAIIVPAILVVILFAMTMSRLANQA